MNRTPLYLLIAFVGLALTGCAATTKSSNKPSAWDSGAAGSEPVNTEALRRDLMNYADRFTSSMALAYDDLADKTSGADLKNLITDRKLNNVASAYTNATELNPIVGLLDMLVMVELLRPASEQPWFSEMFGQQNASEIVIKLRAQEEDIWTLAARYLTQGQLEELGDAIEKWRQEHPTEHYVAMVRLSDFPQAKSSPSAHKEKGSVFGLLFLDPLAGIEPALREVERSRELAERVYFYLQRMPMLVSWRVEALSDRTLRRPEMQQLMKNASKFAAIAPRFTSNAEAITKVVRGLPQQMSEERKVAVEHVFRKTTEERTAAVTQVTQAVSVERDIAIRQTAQAIAVERDAAVKQVAKAVAAERQVVVGDVGAALQTQREAFVHDMEAVTRRTIRLIFVLVCAAVLLAVVLAAVASLFVRRYVARRRSAWTHGNSKPFARMAHSSDRPSIPPARIA